MKTLIRIIICGLAMLCTIQFVNAQNVGIGLTTPLQKLHVDGTARFNALAGSGNRMVIADGNGDLSIQAIPLAGPLNSLTNVNASPSTGQTLIWNGAQWVAGSVGDISGVSAGAGLTGGGTSGTPTLNAAANNGINIDATADRIQWGGALTETTTITQGIYSTIFNLTSSGDFLIRDNGTNRFGVLDNGRTTVGGTASAGMFNVTGNSFFSDDIYVRDGGVSAGDYLVRLYDSADDGIIDIYRNNVVTNRLHANGSSFINGGNLGLGTTAPVQKLHVIGTGRFSTLAGTATRMVVANPDGDLNTQAIPLGDITGITAGGGLIGGGTAGTPIISAAANNGLLIDATADRIQLGGPLTENTTITQDIYSMNFELNSTGDFSITDSGVNRFSVQDNGITTVGSGAGIGTFNVTGSSYFTNDLYLKDGILGGINLVRIFDSSDDGIIDVYRAGSVVNRIHGNGNSFINGGNLGLGTTVPDQKLHVIGTGRFSSLSGTGDRMVIADADGDLATQAIPGAGPINDLTNVNASPATNQALIWNGSQWVAGTVGDITGVTAGAGLAGGGTFGSPTIVASANNGLTVDATADRIQWGGLLTETTTITNGIYSTIFNLNNSGDFLIRDNGLNRFGVLDNGRTTVGGTNASGMFNVTGNSFYSDDLWLRDGSVNAGDFLIRLYDSSDDGVIDVYRNNVVTNRINGNGSSFITGGDFGLGTASPSSPLDVYSNASKVNGVEVDFRSTQPTNQGLNVANTSVINNGRLNGLRAETKSFTPNLPFLSTGVLSYATGSGPRKVGVASYADCTGGYSYTYAVHGVLQNTASGTGSKYAGFFAGDVYSTGSYLPSFRALKQNIQFASPAISKLMQLEVKSYEYRTEEFESMNLPKGTQTGFMADEIKSVYPGLVSKAVQPADDDKLDAKDFEFEAVNYTGLIPDLVKGTQEQQELIENLESEIKILKEQVGEVDRLKAEMAEMKSIIQSLKKD